MAEKSPQPAGPVLSSLAVELARHPHFIEKSQENAQRVLSRFGMPGAGGTGIGPGDDGGRAGTNATIGENYSAFGRGGADDLQHDQVGGGRGASPSFKNDGAFLLSQPGHRLKLDPAFTIGKHLPLIGMAQNLHLQPRPRLLGGDMPHLKTPMPESRFRGVVGGPPTPGSTPSVSLAATPLLGVVAKDNSQRTSATSQKQNARPPGPDVQIIVNKHEIGPTPASPFAEEDELPPLPSDGWDPEGHRLTAGQETNGRRPQTNNYDPAFVPSSGGASTGPGGTRQELQRGRGRTEPDPFAAARKPTVSSSTHMPSVPSRDAVLDAREDVVSRTTPPATAGPAETPSSAVSQLGIDEIVRMTLEAIERQGVVPADGVVVDERVREAARKEVRKIAADRAADRAEERLRYTNDYDPMGTYRAVHPEVREKLRSHYHRDDEPDYDAMAHYREMHPDTRDRLRAHYQAAGRSQSWEPDSDAMAHYRDVHPVVRERLRAHYDEPPEPDYDAMAHYRAENLHPETKVVLQTHYEEKKRDPMTHYTNYAAAGGAAQSGPSTTNGVVDDDRANREPKYDAMQHYARRPDKKVPASREQEDVPENLLDGMVFSDPGAPDGAARENLQLGSSTAGGESTTKRQLGMPGGFAQGGNMGAVNMEGFQVQQEVPLPDPGKQRFVLEEEGAPPDKPKKKRKKKVVAATTGVVDEVVVSAGSATGFSGENPVPSFQADTRKADDVVATVVVDSVVAKVAAGAGAGAVPPVDLAALVAPGKEKRKKKKKIVADAGGDKGTALDNGAGTEEFGGSPTVPL